jgi:hypothetical protein
MPVRKFRDVSEMEDTLWREPGDPELLRAIASVWDFAARTCPRHFPPGVYRHHSIEEAKALPGSPRKPPRAGLKQGRRRRRGSRPPGRRAHPGESRA